MSGLRLDEDMHVHSNFSDGANTLLENMEWALRLGLRRLGCVDHVRSDTKWIPEYVEAIANLQALSSIRLTVGIEAKILDIHGHLDLPKNVDGVDFIYAADHQFPLGETHYAPIEIARMIEKGDLKTHTAIENLVSAYLRVLDQYPHIVLAHLFSILPKINLSEAIVPENFLMELAQKAKETNAIIEVDERWRCPSVRTLQYFEKAGVPIVASTDSHQRETIGIYRYNHSVDKALRGLSCG